MLNVIEVKPMLHAGWEMREGTWGLEIWHDSELVVNESFEVRSN